jgi:hypothetical protein
VEWLFPPKEDIRRDEATRRPTAVVVDVLVPASAIAAPQGRRQVCL